MALVLTQRRLLSVEISSPMGMGKGGEVKGIAGEAPIGDVDSIELKRLLLGKVVNVSVRGEQFKLEVNAKADARRPGRRLQARPGLTRGADRNRTGVNGFAGRCVATPPRRRAAP